jgi:rubrerythrin
LEAIRLADLEGLYQEQVAEAMNVSRQTLGRILDSAHRKVAEALVQGKMLRIEGGNIEMNDTRNFTCSACGHTWQVPFGTGRPTGCPSCASANFHRSESPCGRGAGRGLCHRAGGRRRQGPAQ